MDTDALILDLARKGARRPLPGLWRQMSLWLAGMFIWLGAVACYSGFRPDLTDKMMQLLYPAELALLFGLGVALARGALALSRPDRGQRSGVFLIPALFLFAWIPVALSGMSPMTDQSAAQAFDARHFDCLACILTLCVPPGIAMFLTVRLGAPIRTIRAGGMAAASAAAFSYLGMRLLEANDDPLHLLIWHAAPVLTLSLIGMAAGKILLRG